MSKKEKTLKQEMDDTSKHLRTLYSNGLIGLFFHTFEDGEEYRIVGKQGVVAANPEPGYYLVHYFEWLTGMDFRVAIVHIRDMDQWEFYRTNQEMKDEWEHNYKHRRDSKGKKRGRTN